MQSANTPSNEYRPGRANSCLSRGAKQSTNTIKISASAFVYLERNPSPVNNPVTGQYHEKRGLFSTANQNVNIAARQKKTDNASMVNRNETIENIGVTLNAQPAHATEVIL